MKPGILALFSFILVVLAGPGALQPAPARAKLVTIEITGVVDYVYNAYAFLGVEIRAGDLITGYYRYDTATPDSSPIGNYADYWHRGVAGSFYLNIKGAEFQTDPDKVDLHLMISNGGHLIDRYSVTSHSNLFFAEERPVQKMYWTLEDSTGTALESDALLGSPPLLDDWDFNYLYIAGPERKAGATSPEPTFVITGHVISAVPEPATMFLLTIGVVLSRRHK